MNGGTRVGAPTSERAEAAAGGRVRILAVGNMYPPQHAGGYELMWQRAMRRALELGHAVRVLTSDYVSVSDLQEEQDVHRTLRWYWDLEKYRFPDLSLIERLRLERHNARELERHLQSFEPDVVTWWSMGCMSLSLIEQVRRTGLPAVFVVHDDWLDYGWERDLWLRTWRGPRRGRIAPLAQRLCGVPTRVEASRAGGFIFNSRYILDRAREAGFTADDAEVIPPGVDETFVEPVAPQPWRWRLAYAGRIDRQKGVDTVVAALAHLPEEATLEVVGSGDQHYVAEMEALADRLGFAGRVRFEGFADAGRMRAAYADVDVVVFPVRWNEPFGLVPLEAMGVGRPVVATARGGTAEYVRDEENALVFEPDDALGLARCVERLAGDDSLRARLVEAGRRTAERYTAARFAERTVDRIVGAARLGPAAGRG